MVQDVLAYVSLGAKDTADGPPDLGGTASNLGRRSLEERQDVRVGLHPPDEVHHDQDEQNRGQQDPQRAQGVPARVL